MINKVSLDQTTTSQNLLTVPQGLEYQVTKIFIINTDTTEQTYNIYLIPSGETSDNTTLLYSNQTISQGQTIVINDKIQLNDGDSIQVELVSPSNTEPVNFFVSYIEI